MHPIVKLILKLVRNWIEFYRTIGVNKFYFYDLSMGDETKAIVEEYVRIGVIDITSWVVLLLL